MSDATPRRPGIHDPREMHVAFAGLLVPGLGHALAGRPMRGVVVLTLGTFALGAAAWLTFDAGFVVLLVAPLAIALTSALGAVSAAAHASERGGLTRRRQWGALLVYVALGAPLAFGSATLVRRNVVDVLRVAPKSHTTGVVALSVSSPAAPRRNDVHFVLAKRLGSRPRTGDLVVTSRSRTVVPGRHTLLVVCATEGDVLTGWICTLDHVGTGSWECSTRDQLYNVEPGQRIVALGGKRFVRVASRVVEYRGGTGRSRLHTHRDGGWRTPLVTIGHVLLTHETGQKRVSFEHSGRRLR